MRIKQMKNQEEGEKEQMKQSKIDERGFCKGKMKRLDEQGVTLVALVVTIIIMLILAGIALNIALGDNGLIRMAKKATEKYKEAQDNEEESLNTVVDKLEDPNLRLNIKVKINGKVERLTKDNFAKYLGMEVLNFKELGTGIEEVDIANIQLSDKSEKVKVSTKYRLYYIDFDNKFGDGEGTIYLKADCTANTYKLTLDDTEADNIKVKIKQFNPCLYSKGIITPNKDNDNMKAVTWLLNENNWKDIKTNLKDGVAKKLNYIVGAPSLEMMMDSYNTHYGLKGERPVLGDIEVGRERKKLFYKYENDAKGYLVGPATAAEYSNDFTASYTVQSDDKIDSMYYPNDNKNYWLASPAAYFSDLQYRVYLVHSTKGGIVYHNYAVDGRSGFCPLASLKPSFELELEGNIE